MRFSRSLNIKLFLVSAFCLPPLLLSLISIRVLAGYDQLLYAHLPTYLMIRGLQDFAAIFFVFGLFSLCIFLPARYRLIGIITGGTAYFLIYEWLLMDFLMINYSRSRMENTFLMFLLSPSEFLGSLSFSATLLCLVSGLVVMAVSLMVAYAAHRQKLFFQVKRNLIFFGTVFFIIVQLMVIWFPNRWFLYDSNALTRLLMNGIRNRWLSQFNLEKADGMVAAYFKDNNEIAQKTDVAYPLLKRHLSYCGVRRFQLVNTDEPIRHVIFIFMESFRGIDVGVLKNDGTESITPSFDRLSKQGILFRNFYSNSTETSRALLASLYGIIPLSIPESIQLNYPFTKLRGIPDIFDEKGYSTAYFSGTNPDLLRQRAFIPRHGFRKMHSGFDVIKEYPHATSSRWGVNDLETFSSFLNWLGDQEQRKRKTFSAIFTITNHYPFILDAEDWRNVNNDSYPAMLARFHKTMRYSDHCLGKFFDVMEKVGIAKNSLFFILGDHGIKISPKNKLFFEKDVSESSVKIPLLILAPGHLSASMVIDDLASQIDIMPTLMDLMDINNVEVSCMGRSLVRRQSQSCDVNLSSPHAYYIGLRSGSLKYTFNMATGQQGVYDLKHDPLEQRNIADQYPLLIEKFGGKALRVQELMQMLILGDRIYRSTSTQVPVDARL